MRIAGIAKSTTPVFEATAAEECDRNHQSELGLMRGAPSTAEDASRAGANLMRL